jgi:adenine-specific DNA-methyltransferase
MIKFNEKYSKENFVSFLEDFLPEDFSEREEDIVIKKDRYKQITKAKIFSESLDLHVLEMDHTHENDPRITIATDAFKILADHWVHQALVVFKNTESENYRLSYLTISLDLNDKNKAVKKYSNARRYSFYLGSHAKVKTPEQQLIKKGRVIDSADLIARFSVEVVNKQFYLEIAKHFDELVSTGDINLSLPGVSKEDVNIRKSFAVRLIGRIMFCWFLKQKKSDSGQLIPDELLSSNVVANNYYHSILEPLFFEVLNTSIDVRDIRDDLFDKVPYLNGGLFNPQSEDYYELDRGTFASKYINTLKINDQWFKDFFELLERYNFTIDENTVFDQELSVDPEMLGRIFENLLAEINPETGGSERKRTGSFYTPRQIVEYMVDQSLLEYFKSKTNISDKKLSAVVSYDLADDTEYPLEEEEKQEIINAIESLKILDPACGSGAYPIGALQKIVYILQQIDPDCKMWLDKKLKDVPDLYKQKIINDIKQNPFDYTRKLDVIKNSIFGVDIQPIAVDVSRLRCFLTLVVEQDINDNAENRNIKPLPNLDFKFVCANTLISAPEQHSPDESSLFGDDFQDKLAITVDKYFSSSGENKRSANNEIHKLIDNKVDQKLKYLNNLVSYNGDKKMESLLAKANKKKIDEHSNILHLWSSYKNIFENKAVGFFEIKYFFPSVKEGFDVVIGNPPYIRVSKIDKEMKESYKEKYRTAHGSYDIYTLFFERAFELLKEGGVYCYITSNKFLIADYAKPLREIILKETKLINLIDLADCKRIFESALVSPIITLGKNIKLPEYSVGVIALKDDDVEKINSIKFTQTNNPFAIHLINEDTSNLMDKIRKNSIELDKIADIRTGVMGFDYWSLEPFVHNKKNSGFIRLVTNGFIDQYKFSWGVKGRLYKKDFTEPYLDIENVNLNSNTKDLFRKKKIIIRGVAQRLTANIDTEGYGILVAVHSAIVLDENEYDSRYITGLLNSKMLNWVHLKEFYSARIPEGSLKYPISFIKKIPIFKANLGQQKKIVDLVNDLYSSDISNIENIKITINELVMDFYNLSEDEKEIIRNS